MTLLAKDLMTPNIKSVPQGWTLQHFARFLSDNDISGSPVIDDDGQIIGIATLKDIAEFHWNNVQAKDERMSDEDLQEVRRLRQFIFEEMVKTPVEVRDIMTPIVFSVSETHTVQEVARLMMKEHLHRVFVKRDDEVTGIITTYDMIRIFTDRAMLEACLDP